MVKSAKKPPPTAHQAVAEYKRMLAAIIDRRPSGTRQRLANALTKNRSFISQITNPAYPTPIPIDHLDIVFEICHFSADERRQFLDCYSRAHPKRVGLPQDSHRLKAHTIYLPDMGDDARNEALHVLVSDFVRRIVRFLDESPKKNKGR